MGRSRQSPLVYLSPQARRQAAAFLPLDAVLEVAIGKAIQDGRVSFGREAKVHGPTWTARVARRPAHLRKRGSRAWLVLGVEPKQQLDEEV
jgi:hypothetical protein